MNIINGSVLIVEGVKMSASNVSQKSNKNRRGEDVWTFTGTIIDDSDLSDKSLLLTSYNGGTYSYRKSDCNIIGDLV